MVSSLVRVDAGASKREGQVTCPATVANRSNVIFFALSIVEWLPSYTDCFIRLLLKRRSLRCVRGTHVLIGVPTSGARQRIANIALEMRKDLKSGKMR